MEGDWGAGGAGGHVELGMHLAQGDTELAQGDTIWGHPRDTTFRRGGYIDISLHV